MSSRIVLLTLIVLLTIGGSAFAESPELASAATAVSDVAVPELASLLLLGTGLVAAASAGRRRRGQKRATR